MSDRHATAKRRFDASQEHSSVHGMPGVRWEQGGVLFAADGSPVSIQPVEPGPQLEPEDEDTMPVLNLPDLAEPIELLPYADILEPEDHQPLAPPRFFFTIRDHKVVSSKTFEEATAIRISDREAVANYRRDRLKDDLVVRGRRPHGVLRPFYSLERWKLAVKIASDKSFNLFELVKQWAVLRYGDQPLPSRDDLSLDFRDECGRVTSVNEKTMREVREKLATREQQKGGRPAHKRG
jgi:hypothetical protein